MRQNVQTETLLLSNFESCVVVLKCFIVKCSPSTVVLSVLAHQHHWHSTIGPVLLDQ